MDPDRAWIIGERGFLGGEIRRRFPLEFPDIALHPPLAVPIPWNEPEARDARLLSELRRWSEDVRRSGGSWIILWCAGAGVVSTSKSALTEERQALSRFLEALGRELADVAPEQPGLFLLASSAGGAYAGSEGLPFSEDVPSRPLSDYGAEKLLQEELLGSWLLQRPWVSGFVPRYSNLYGPGQRLDKPQGFISQLTRSVLWRRSLPVYVPLDTIRDYIYIRDAASISIQCLRRLARSRPGGLVTKIVASGHAASLAEIVGILTDTAKHRPRLVTARTGHQQPSRLKFRSTVYPDIVASSPTDLATGIRALYFDQLQLLQRGKLPPPAAVP